MKNRQLAPELKAWLTYNMPWETSYDVKMALADSDLYDLEKLLPKRLEVHPVLQAAGDYPKDVSWGKVIITNWRRDDDQSDT